MVQNKNILVGLAKASCSLVENLSSSLAHMVKGSAHLSGSWDMVKVMVSLATSAITQPRSIAVGMKRSINHPGMIANKAKIVQIAVEAGGRIQEAIVIGIRQRCRWGEAAEAHIVVIDAVISATVKKGQDFGMVRGTGIIDGRTAAGNVVRDMFSNKSLHGAVSVSA